MNHSEIAIAFSLVSFVASGCAFMGFRSSERLLVEQASFDHECPAEHVKVLDSMEGGMGQTSFKLDVCGTERQYERMGTSYYEKGNPPKTGMNVK